MKSMINAKEIDIPGFSSGEFMRAHYQSLNPHEKFITPQLTSHGYGWRAAGSHNPGRKPLETPALAKRHGRVNCRLSTNDPL